MKSLTDLTNEARAARPRAAGGVSMVPASAAMKLAGGDELSVTVRWTRVNPPSGVVRECERTDWYLNGKRISAAAAQAAWTVAQGGAL